MRKIKKDPTQGELKSLLLAFYRFKIATGFQPETADEDFLAGFNVNYDIASILLHCESINTSNCSVALKASANCIISMFTSN
jgi:hypothetical protein